MVSCADRRRPGQGPDYGIGLVVCTFLLGLAAWLIALGPIASAAAEGHVAGTSKVFTITTYESASHTYDPSCGLSAEQALAQDDAEHQRLGLRAAPPDCSVVVLGFVNAAEDEVGLARYADGGGHHIPAKSGFRGANGFDPGEAPAVPKAEFSRLGINHATITGAQARLHSAFARGGGDLTWDAMQSIETQGMIAGGAEAGAAQSVVARAIAALHDARVSGPTRIPWGG